MKQLTFLEKIFSITNQNEYKTVCILGIKFKIDRTNFFKINCLNLPINKNKIVFINFKGKGYGCNLKYICEEIIKRNLPYEIVWLIKNSDESILFDMPKCIRIVDYKSEEALKELATAKIWIDNQRKIYHIKKGLIKKENQYYIQTWHGSLGIKKIGLDSPLTDTNADWIPFGIKDAEMIDFILSNSDFESEVFKRNFWDNGQIIKVGHPRNDIFFRSEEETLKIKNKVYNYFSINKNKKILLYAPSYRDNNMLEPFKMEYLDIPKILQEKFGGEWVIMFRLHPNLLKYTKELIPQREFIYNANLYPDIQELLATADIVITDYSSCIFDFMLTKRPAFIYANDINEYDKDRGFYYPLTSTPFPVAQNNEDLKNNILNLDYEIYKQKVEEFLKEKGCMEDGHASERVVDLIEQIMDNESNNSN